ncbi:hypothetical protein [Ramlibacter tataouinensis]|uniref:Uncharacterized protein n=1 Tax=Ramlibacter tataouinensis (strain ATCC BAA-407 / DSM 14655 / LMG 21543 / TTB310) TaxID=365046 RepID=F5Y408_RAMTT|nr:hypothetical protein [Ramlibacter tataouinensis]AEG91286.1 Hypothetical protein Rta_02220 [Ramlibacter tataouinensis TTB310]
MIQLATDPNASRMNWRPAASDGKANNFELRRGRSGHAWPFLAREALRPASPQAPKTPSDSGS